MSITVVVAAKPVQQISAAVEASVFVLLSKAIVPENASMSTQIENTVVVVVKPVKRVISASMVVVFWIVPRIPFRAPVTAVASICKRPPNTVVVVAKLVQQISAVLAVNVSVLPKKLSVVEAVQIRIPISAIAELVNALVKRVKSVVQVAVRPIALVKQKASVLVAATICKNIPSTVASVEMLVKPVSTAKLVLVNVQMDCSCVREQTNVSIQKPTSNTAVVVAKSVKMANAATKASVSHPAQKAQRRIASVAA